MKYRIRKSIRCSSSCRYTDPVGKMYGPKYDDINRAHEVAASSNRAHSCGCRVEVIEVESGVI